MGKAFQTWIEKKEKKNQELKGNISTTVYYRSSTMYQLFEAVFEKRQRTYRFHILGHTIKHDGSTSPMIR
jgi:hypothetical protein